MDLKEVGHTIQIAGVVYSSDKDEETYVLMLPDETFYVDLVDRVVKHMTLEEWEKFFWQTDVLETEVKTKNGKIIIRKANRQIDANISWKVYERDNYACRYCGRSGIPLTVDHCILWEDGGPSIKENLLTSCRRCNRVRGNTPYEEWITSNVYKKFAKGIKPKVFIENVNVVYSLKDIPISFHKMRGKKR